MISCASTVSRMLASMAAKHASVTSMWFRIPSAVVECQFGGDLGSHMIRIDCLAMSEFAAQDLVVVHGLRNATNLNGKTMGVWEVIESTGRAVCVHPTLGKHSISLVRGHDWRLGGERIRAPS